MFTGIIDHCGNITAVEKTTIRIAGQFNDWQLGESIAVDGICLTVTQFGETYFECDISAETRLVTTANQFQPGKPVNLERPLRLSDRLGGHIVQGHVDQVAYVAEREAVEECVKLVFTGITATMQRLLIPKGSVAVNGVSLTLNRVMPRAFEVMLIPHTLQRTNLEQLQPGDAVNIEYDWFAKVVSHQLETYEHLRRSTE
ncbi:MAG: riboflavin synthase [Gammaproteobacteria bacterium]